MAIVARAVRFIRRHACDGINVQDVPREVRVARATLNRRFNRALHRSPKAEIIQVKLHRVKQLLAETEFSLARIARLTGFENPEYLSVVFKQKTGRTASAYRKESRRAAR